MAKPTSSLMLSVSVLCRDWMNTKAIFCVLLFTTCFERHRFVLGDQLGRRFFDPVDVIRGVVLDLNGPNSSGVDYHSTLERMNSMYFQSDHKIIVDSTTLVVNDDGPVLLGYVMVMDPTEFDRVRVMYPTPDEIIVVHDNNTCVTIALNTTVVPGTSEADTNTSVLAFLDVLGSLRYDHLGTIDSETRSEVRIEFQLHQEHFPSQVAEAIITFAVGKLVTLSTPGVIVAKSFSNGTEIWSTSIGDVDNTIGHSAIVIDGEDCDVYVVGETTGGFGIDEIGGGDGFVVKLHSENGSVAWVRQVGSSATDFASSVSEHIDGDILVSGTTHGVIEGTNSTGGSSDGFVVKYSPDGEVRWVRQFGTTAEDASGFAVRSDSSGSVVVYGYTTFGGTPWGLLLTTFDDVGNVLSNTVTALQ
eukprot:m.45368 g.45368  ORF g.45368 m.45368 type:complete len:415 (-) comp19950_c0_seq1:28-1272(-)